MSRLAVFLLLVLPLLGIASASAESPPTFNRVSFQVSADREVENDLMVIVLFAQADGRDAVQPADEVNRSMEWALSLTGAHAEIKAQTLGYRTQAIYKDGRIRGWRVRQSLRLEGADSRILGDLAGRLQERLMIESVGYQVSDTLRRDEVAALTQQALDRFSERAKAVASALGRRNYRLVRLNINDNAGGPVPIVRAMMAEARADAGPAPARIEAGTQRVSVSVDGEIEVSDD